MKQVFVHRTSSLHSNRRAKFKRLYRRGSIELKERTKDGWIYRVPNEITAPKD